MSLGFVLRRILLFFVVLWGATTLIFFLPKLASGRDPISERLGMLASSGSVSAESIQEMVEAYQRNFGLDQPLWKQYLTYMSNVFRLDFNYSLSMYPAKVIDLIMVALPWTIGLLLTTTVISVVLGTLLGGLMAWPRSPRALKHLALPLVMLSSIPYYLVGIILMYFLAFQLKWFPLGGASTMGTEPNLSLGYILDVLHHSILPALSIVISSIGFWALTMRGMMVTTVGEDYIMLAEAKGLSDRRIFTWYALRNALLPQTTALALSLGTVVSGALLVEVIFRYPGVGSLLYRAIVGFDYFTIYGVVFFIIVTISLATLILDLVYPLLDPRIRYQSA